MVVALPALPATLLCRQRRVIVDPIQRSALGCSLAILVRDLNEGNSVTVESRLNLPVLGSQARTQQVWKLLDPHVLVLAWVQCTRAVQEVDEAHPDHPGEQTEGQLGRKRTWLAMLLQRPESVELDASHHSSKPCIAATPRPLVAIFQLPEDGFACPETLGGGVDLGLVGRELSTPK